MCLNMICIAHLTGSCRGFQTTSRANTLAQKILKADIAQGLDDAVTQYTADNCMLSYGPFTWRMTFIADLSLNGVQMSPNFNYNDPPLPFVINGLQDPTSQRVLVLGTPGSA